MSFKSIALFVILGAIGVVFGNNQSEVFADSASPRMVGGPSAEKPGDADAQQVADTVRQDFEARLTGEDHLSEYVVESYRTQLVNGVNYFLKVRTAPGRYIHARVHKPFSGDNIQIHSIQKNKSKEDLLQNF